MNRLLFVMSALFVLGCGGTTTVKGTVAGNVLAPKDSLFTIQKDSKGQIEAVYLFISDQPNLCDSLNSNRTPKSQTALLFTLVNVDGVNKTNLPVTTGPYVVNSTGVTNGLFAQANFEKDDATCKPVVVAYASPGMNGSLKIDQLDTGLAGRLTGSFDVALGQQADVLSGTIDAHLCPLSGVSGAATCQ